MHCITETSEALQVLEGVKASLMLMAESDLQLDAEQMGQALFNQAQLIREACEVIRAESQ